MFYSRLFRSSQVSHDAVAPPVYLLRVQLLSRGSPARSRGKVRAPALVVDVEEEGDERTCLKPLEVAVGAVGVLVCLLKSPV
jgi:hypothetical protein